MRGQTAFQEMLNKCIEREDPDIRLDMNMDEEEKGAEW